MATDSLIYAFSLVSEYGSIFFAAVVLAILWLKKDKKLLILFILDLAAISLIVYGLKFFTNMPRPGSLTVQPSVLPSSDSSFPSGHASRAFLYSAFLSHEFEKFFQDILYLFAALAAIGRVVTGAHTAIDVIVGSAIGFVVSWLTLRYQKQILRFFKVR